MHHDVTGIVLAGGKSSRMGIDKSKLKIGHKPVVEIAVDLMMSVCKENILSIGANTGDAILSLPGVRDVYPDAGPLAGIHAGLCESGTEKNFIISCDVPLMTREMIEYIIAQAADAPIVVACIAGYVEPLVGLYCKRILPQIENMLAGTAAMSDSRKRYSVHGLFERVETKIIDPTGLPFYRKELFFNMNDKDDYAKIVKLSVDRP